MAENSVNKNAFASLLPLLGQRFGNKITHPINQASNPSERLLPEIHPKMQPPVRQKSQNYLIYSVSPLGLDNTVGMGITLGFLFQAAVNWSVAFPRERVSVVNVILMSLHLASFVLVLGNLVYQLVFWIFRQFNRKLVPNTRYQTALERCMQFLFGLCLGGFLMYHWKHMYDKATCISQGYCPDSASMKRFLAMKDEICTEDWTLCKDFFFGMPFFLQTFRSVTAATFLMLFFESRIQLQAANAYACF